MSTNAGAAVDEEENGGSDGEGDGVGDEEEWRSDGSYSGPVTERESSGISVKDETGEPEPHQTWMQTPRPLLQL